MRLDGLRWTELSQAVARVCLVPLGSMEQHGLHLPLGTDTAIVGEIARRVEQRHPEHVLLAPAQWLGHSRNHAKFGCVSLDVRPYMDLIGGICRSLAGMGARKILLLNGHGGNDAPCCAALPELKAEMPEVRIAFASYWRLAGAAFESIRTSPAGGMGHACEMETSIMLALHPDQVRLDLARDGGTFGESGYRVLDMLRPQPYVLPRAFHELSPTGTLGMPSHATREKGEAFLDAAVDAVAHFVCAFARGEVVDS